MKKEKKEKEKPKTKDRKPEVTYSQPFLATIRRDGIFNRMVIKHERYYQDQLQKFRDGEEVTLTLTNKKQKRTLAQNAYYWGVYLPLIARETGENEIERLHELFKGKFLTKEIAVVLGEKVRIKKSTTEMGIGEFSRYMLSIQGLTGIEAPPTEDYNLLSLEKGAKELDVDMVKDGEISTDFLPK